MSSDQRLFEIRGLLETELDCEEEYLNPSEMADYMNFYATDAADRLSRLFGPFGPTDAAVIHCCVAAISKPERIKQGRSQKLLLQLRGRSVPILDVLADSTDPQLRIFGLETCKNHTHGGCRDRECAKRIRLLGGRHEASASRSGAGRSLAAIATHCYRTIQDARTRRCS